VTRGLAQYQIDAFTETLFRGNPAAVCPLDDWLDDTLLQAIAAENNLSETAFFVPRDGRFALRWFTPAAEVDLCGHATLAAAYVLFEILGHRADVVRFDTRSGELVVRRAGAELAMDFPARMPKACAAPEALIAGLRVTPLEVLAADDYIVVLENEAQVRAVAPDLAALSTLDLRGVGITARGTDVDVVSRFFAPRVGVPEDPVTGSLHCALAPYWSTRLGRTRFTARQVSRRGGTLRCELVGDRVILYGRAVKFMEARIELPD
jgi:PhzF family phenazine biosynthesis protein